MYMFPLPILRKNSVRLGSIALLFSLLGSNCSSYSKSQALTREVSVGYGQGVSPKRPENMQHLMGAGLDLGSTAASYVIGYIFDEVTDRIREERAGDITKKGIVLNDTSTFPRGGYFVVIRTVSDPDGSRFPGVATVEDFIKNRTGTLGGDLNKAVVKSASGKDGAALTSGRLSKTVDAALKREVAAGDKIALLVVCPILPLNEGGAGASIHAIGLTGIYYPIIGGARFSVESQDLARRIAKSKESMTLEVYGPQGTGYSTGVAKVPLVWNPPTKGGNAQWMDSAALYGSLIDKGQRRELGDLLTKKMNSRLAKRQAFVAPDDDIRPLLRADLKVLEATEATGWLLEQVDKVEQDINGSIP